jgi:hypothetical protein
MSARANTWYVNERAGREQSKRESVNNSWRLLELVASRADDHGVCRDGLNELGEAFGCTSRTIRSYLDRLESGEVIRRVPQYGGLRGRLPDAIVLAAWADQPARRPMLILPSDLRAEVNNA